MKKKTMNEKEIEKIRKRFFTEFTTVSGKTTNWYEFTKDPIEVLIWIEKEVVKAHHKGCMEGTMEAL